MNIKVSEPVVVTEPETPLEDVSDAIMELPGLKREDLQRCCRCGKGLGDCGLTFYRVTVERFMLHLPNIQRRHGLETFFGGGGAGAALAGAMGTDDDLARPITLPVQVLICEDCAIRPGPLMELEPRPC